MYSAIKVGGVPLYRLARKGKEIPRKPREVFIRDIKLLDFSVPLIKFDVTCSKGTYIRTLCADIGNYLGVGAHMWSLDRLRSGDYTLKDALYVLCKSFGKENAIESPLLKGLKIDLKKIF